MKKCTACKYVIGDEDSGHTYNDRLICDDCFTMIYDHCIVDDIDPDYCDDHEVASVEQIQDTFTPKVSHGFVTVYTSAKGWLYDVGSIGNVFGVSIDHR